MARQNSRGSTISTVFNLHAEKKPAAGLDQSEMKLVADYLAVLRTAATGLPTVSDETSAELEEYLALAEAALRRATAELQIYDAPLEL